MFTKLDIEKYFNAEKNESIIFITLGILAIVIAGFFLFYLKKDIHKGAAIPLIIVGLIHLTIGYTIFSKSDKDRKTNVYAFDMNPTHFKETELPRIEKVNKNFIIYKYIEIVLFIIGISMYFYFKQKGAYFFLMGFGAALAIEAMVSLSADYFAEKRAINYSNGIKEYLIVRRF